jgi:hypothetical protein
VRLWADAAVLILREQVVLIILGATLFLLASSRVVLPRFGATMPGGSLHSLAFPSAMYGVRLFTEVPAGFRLLAADLRLKG